MQVKISLLARTIKVELSNINCEWIVITFLINRGKKVTKGERKRKKLHTPSTFIAEMQRKEKKYTLILLLHIKIKISYFQYKGILNERKYY